MMQARDEILHLLNSNEQAMNERRTLAVSSLDFYLLLNSLTLIAEVLLDIRDLLVTVEAPNDQ